MPLQQNSSPADLFSDQSFHLEQKNNWEMLLKIITLVIIPRFRWLWDNYYDFVVFTCCNRWITMTKVSFDKKYFEKTDFKSWTNFVKTSCSLVKCHRDNLKWRYQPEYWKPFLYCRKVKQIFINTYLSCSHCVKSVHIRSFSGMYFLALGLDAERYGVSLCIQSESGKMRTRKTPNKDTFHAVILWYWAETYSKSYQTS